MEKRLAIFYAASIALVSTTGVYCWRHFHDWLLVIGMAGASWLVLMLILGLLADLRARIQARTAR